MFQMLNMSLGFLGIQYGFGLQNANVSRIFETLGAEISLIPILWLAAPVTGLFIQPLMGKYSDRTWNRLGRRKPYFLGGALVASAGLLIMPSAPLLWVAAGALWLMDSAINMTMESFRAFVSDMVNEDQKNRAFALQSFIIGIGSVLASVMPAFLSKIGVSNVSFGGSIPSTVGFAFYIGAFLFLTTVLWTIFRTKEHNPNEFKTFSQLHPSVSENKTSLMYDIFHMPAIMKKLALVQFFTWTALFTMWVYMTASTTRHVFDTTDPSSGLYNEGANWVGICFAIYNGVGAAFSFFIPHFAKKTNRTVTHSICLLFGGLGIGSMFFVNEPWQMIPGMIALGLAWSSLLSMPYAILSGALPPQKVGVYMGVFSFFIAIPKIVTSLFLGWFTNYLFAGDPVYSLLMAGFMMLLASLFMLRVKEAQKQDVHL